MWAYSCKPSLSSHRLRQALIVQLHEQEQLRSMPPGPDLINSAWTLQSSTLCAHSGLLCVQVSAQGGFPLWRL